MSTKKEEENCLLLSNQFFRGIEMSDENGILDFFKEFEEKTKIKLPANISRTLCAMGYSKDSIGHVEHTTLIDEIQDTVRNIMSSLLSNDEKDAFFGQLFKDNPTNFVFFAGHKAIIRKLVDYAKKDYFLISGKCSKKRKLEDGNDSSAKETKKMLESAEALILEWLQNKKIDGIEKIYYKDLVVNDQEVTASIICPLCKMTQKIHKANKDSPRASWNLSNLYRHMKKDLGEQEANKDNGKTKVDIQEFFPRKPATEAATIVESESKAMNEENILRLESSSESLEMGEAVQKGKLLP